MEIKEILEEGKEELKDLKYIDPLKESIYILSKIIGKDKSYIFTNLDKWVSKAEEDNFFKYIRDRASGKPMAYIFNHKEFMGLDFYIESGVLIPRPETEELVEYIVEYIDKNFKGEAIKLLDIGVGSGAISLSIANFCKNAKIVGVDISDRALRVANKNLASLKLTNVNFQKSNLFESIQKTEKFSIIVSNPPYIKTDVIDGLQRDVKDFEPAIALDGGEDGLLFYRKIIKASKEYLQPKGMLIFEIGYDQGESVSGLLVDEGFKSIEVFKDFGGHDRIVLGFKG